MEVVSAFGVGFTVAVRPCIGLAGNLRGGGMHRIVDGQVQSIDLCATVSIGVTVEVVSAFGVGFTVAVRPCVGLAGRGRERGVHRVVDGEVQGIDLRAAVSIGVDVGVVAAYRVGLCGSIHTGPYVGLAGRGRDCRMHRIVDGEVQGIDLRATVSIGVAVGVVAAFVVGLCGSVHTDPGVGLAGRGRDCRMNGIVDGEVQGIDLRATVSIGVAVGVVAAFVVGLCGSVHTGPGVGLAGRGRQCCM